MVESIDKPDTYNGWKNYETWCANLWMGNDQGSDEHYREMAQEAWNDAKGPSENAKFTGHEPFTREQRAMLKMSESLKEEFEEGNPLAERVDFWSDMMNAALSEVNWHEIAGHYIDDADKTAETDDDAE